MLNEYFRWQFRAVAVAMTVTASALFAASKPNVLLILTDQQHGNMLSCAGNPWVRTPHLDRLAADGIRFGRAYTANPVCIPARFSLMTGELPSVIGMEDNEDHTNPVPHEILSQSLGHVFQRAGYCTAYAGKKHLPGQDGVREQVKAYGFEVHLAPRDFIGREPTVEACVQFLKEPHDRPFLLVASLVNPHDICYLAIRDYYEGGGERKWGLERGAIAELDNALALPQGVSEQQFYQEHCPPLPACHGIPADELSAPLVRRAADVPFVLWARRTWDERKWRLHRWAYARLTERVDEQIGRILGALREAGLEQNTIVVMTSDHGEQDGAQRLVHKAFFYEASIHVPLLFRWPGMIPAGQVDARHLVCNGTDLLPTLCDLAGVPTAKAYPGRSLRPLMRGHSEGGWREAFVVETRFGRLLHMGRWKYEVCVPADQMPDKYKPFLPQRYVREVLVDLQSDPCEQTNRANDPACATILQRARRLLRESYEAMRQPLDGRYVVAPRKER